MHFKRFLASGLLLGALGGSAFAGTAGISGVYTGKYDLNILGATLAVQGICAKSLNSYKWTFDFDAQTLYLSDGKIASPTARIRYKMYPDGNLIDNNDGTYTYRYKFQPLNPTMPSPAVSATTTFDITQTKDGLVIKTIDSDYDGILGSMSTHPQLDYGLVLPRKIELDFVGKATLKTNEGE